MKRNSFLKLSSLALAIATVSSGAYSAQLEEIIVTAQKRAESLQDVPISMTAVSGKKISEAGMNSFADLSTYVPNLSISENAAQALSSLLNSPSVSMSMASIWPRAVKFAPACSIWLR